jgi:hypothetical protein
MLLCLILGVFVSPFASPDPDGLERVAEDKGFLEKAENEDIVLWKSSPIPDYAVAGVENEKVATGIAGLIGVLVTFVIGGGIAFIIVKLKSQKSQTT